MLVKDAACGPTRRPHDCNPQAAGYLCMRKVPAVCTEESEAPRDPREPDRDEILSESFPVPQAFSNRKVPGRAARVPRELQTYPGDTAPGSLRGTGRRAAAGARHV